MLSSNKEVALRKRQQIDSSKRTMFIVVAAVAFVSGIALVVSFLLIQQILFHGKIIAEKQTTLNTVKGNIEAVDTLKSNILVLDTNMALNSVRTSEQSTALQAILDALPAEANIDALGASLQIRFVGEVSGLQLESLVISGDEAVASEEATPSEEGVIPSLEFRMSVIGSAPQLKELLARMERSIRVMEITSVDIQAGNDTLTMSLVGRAYYQPAQSVELGEKVVPSRGESK